jgi:hypothetical protein
MEKSVWLSYDLGVRGDYEGLYSWLDGKEAVECGNSIAFFKINIGDNEDLIEKIKSEIKASVDIKNGERFYIIYRRADKTIAGKYIFGNRKANPWTGYKAQPAEEDA